MRADDFRFELRARLNRHADDVLLRICLTDGESVELTGGEILQKSCQLARIAMAPPGQVVLVLLPHSVELFLLHIGLVLTGRVPAILPWPTSRVDPEKYQRNLLHQFRNLPADEVITIPRLVPALASEMSCRVVGCDISDPGHSQGAFSNGLPFLENDRANAGDIRFQDPGEALFLQFSGGTTGSQKAVVITAPILTRQLESLRQSLRFSSADVVVSWLPLYHDMGLIGSVWLPIWHGAPSVQFSAGEWLLNPGLLFEYLERYKGTFCWLPNFALSYLAGQRERMAGPRSLGHVRGYIDCSEPVRLRSIRKFVETFADWGVTMPQVQVSYALAENVFAVTQTHLGRQPRTFARAAVTRGGRGKPLAFDLLDDVYVSSGAPIPGVKVRIVNSEGICLEREAGEIQLLTESLFGGYWGASGFATGAFTDDGWYATGDFGFWSDGELYVIGRLKDIVIVGGQNILPEDVETLVSAAPGIYPGRVAAFGVASPYDTEILIVVAEMRGAYDRDRAVALQKEIAGLVRTAIGSAPGQVCVVPERWIVKSTAGKIAREETRERYLRQHARLLQPHCAAAEAR